MWVSSTKRVPSGAFKRFFWHPISFQMTFLGTHQIIHHAVLQIFLLWSDQPKHAVWSVLRLQLLKRRCPRQWCAKIVILRADQLRRSLLGHPSLHLQVLCYKMILTSLLHTNSFGGSGCTPDVLYIYFHNRFVPPMRRQAKATSVHANPSQFGISKRRLR